MINAVLPTRTLCELPRHFSAPVAQPAAPAKPARRESLLPCVEQAMVELSRVHTEFGRERAMGRLVDRLNHKGADGYAHSTEDLKKAIEAVKRERTEAHAKDDLMRELNLQTVLECLNTALAERPVVPAAAIKF